MDGYEPLTWDEGTALDAHEQAVIEQQRRDLWRGGIREPNLTRMAFEFAAVVCLLEGDRRKAPDEALAENLQDASRDAEGPVRGG